MAWVDNIAGCNVRQRFQTLLNNLMALHKTSCKPKNSIYFQAIANLLIDLLNHIDTDTPPTPEGIATLINPLTVQIAEIARKKEGLQNQKDFQDLLAAISKDVTELKNAFENGIRHYTPAPNNQQGATFSDSSSSTVTLRLALVDAQSREQLETTIETLHDIPVDKTCSSILSRAFFKHPVAMGAGLSVFLMGTGATLQSSLNLLQPLINKSIDLCQDALEFRDMRVLTPATLLLGAVVLTGYAVYQSIPNNPAPVKPPNAKEDNTSPLLSDEDRDAEAKLEEGRGTKIKNNK